MLIYSAPSPDAGLAPDRKGRSHPYPTLFTGHELMAIFPPPNPALLEKKVMSTSAYFRHEESVFFAQSNRRMMRGRMEIDLTCGSDAKNGQGVSKGGEPAGEQSGGPHAYQPQQNFITSSSAKSLISSFPISTSWGADPLSIIFIPEVTR